MSDIVEMLRTPTGCVPPSEWELKAAKEIERLRAALQRIADLPPHNMATRAVEKSVREIAVRALKRS